jgi:hypothetical protein
MRVHAYQVFGVVAADKASGMGGDGETWSTADMIGDERGCSGPVGDSPTGRDKKDQKKRVSTKKKKKGERRIKSLT